MGWLAGRYFGECKEFKKLYDKSRRARRACIEDCLREPLKPGGKDLMRDCPVSVFSVAHVRLLRDRKADFPGAADNRRKHLSAMCAWAVEAKLLPMNYVRDVKAIENKTGDGFHTWTMEEVAQFEAYYPIGTMPRLALALLLFTGSRRQDMVDFGPANVVGGKLKFVPKKTLYKRSRVSEKPVLPILADIIAATPCGEKTFLLNGWGVGFTASGFGNWFRKRCSEAGLKHCNAHGIRKAAATRAAENGATEYQMMAIFDWDTPAMAATYIKAANRSRMTGDAIGLLSHRVVAPSQAFEKT
jgi:integrase